MIYNLKDRGCILDGNPAHAAANTAIFQQVEQDARGGNPGPIELDMGGGLAVLDGKLSLGAPNMLLRGFGNMGSVSDWGPTSLIRGFGRGDTLKVPQGGCKITGLAWQGDSQDGNDAFINIAGTQVTVSECLMDGPNVGILVSAPPNVLIGQVWVENVLMVGKFKHAGIDLNNNGGAARLSHVRMFNGTMLPSDPQPNYGILVRSAGELMIDSCDIDNCGVNLAVVPGIDSQPDTYVQNLDIVNSDFDNGNGEGQILIRPYGTSFVLNSQLTNVWCSSVNNGGGTWPANGLTIDGTRSHPRAGFPSIMNVSVSTSVFQNSVRHCGVYANAVHGLSIVNCTAGANYMGFQTYGCLGLISAVKAGAYVPSALGQPTGGNTIYGVLLEKSNMRFNPSDNCLDGNGVPPGWKITP